MSETPDPTSSAAPAPASSPRTDRSLLVVLVIVAVLVVAALVAVFARGGAQQLDPTTPEGVVQLYATAVMQGDYETARALHSSSLTEDGCDSASTFLEPETRLTLVNTRVNGDTAIVTVHFNYGYGGPFGGDSGYQDQFELEKDSASGEWFVSHAPWMFQVCTDQGVIK